MANEKDKKQEPEVRNVIVDIECLQTGMIAAADVMNAYGTPILRKGREVQSKHISQMRLSDIRQIEIVAPPDDEKSQPPSKVHINDYPRHLEKLQAARIMVVDDARSVQLVLAQQFREAGLKVVAVAGNADEALARAQNLKPTLITMDISMPGRDGISAIPELIAMLPDVRIVMITALSDQDRMVQSLEAGAVKFITKPLDYEEVKKAIIETIIPKK